MDKPEDKKYFELLKERSKTSRVYKRHQLIGLLIAELLEDDKYKSLYIKMAKERQNDGDELLRIAKGVAERKRIKNKGAYFMKIVAKNKK